MRIIDAKAFLAMPEGTLFMAIENTTGNLGPLMSKEASYRGQDEVTFEWIRDDDIKV